MNKTKNFKNKENKNNDQYVEENENIQDDDNQEKIDEDIIDNNIHKEEDNKIKRDITDIIFDSINDIAVSLKNLQIEAKNIQKKINILKKDYGKIINIKTKLENKKNNKRNKLQSGFIKPRPLSSELCEFLDIDKNSLKGRNEVTSLINEYIVKNNLRDNKDRRIILPDEKLKNLLKIDESISLSYFNIQKYLKIHFK